MITSIRTWIQRAASGLVIGAALAVVWQLWLLVVDGSYLTAAEMTRHALGLTMIALILDTAARRVAARQARAMSEQARRYRESCERVEVRYSNTEPPVEDAQLVEGQP